MCQAKYGNFKQDLLLGQKYEKLAQIAVIEWLNQGLEVIEERNDNLYDFKLSNGSTYEVKYDRMCSQTGNLYVETQSHSRMAGLSVCQADYYIFAVGEFKTKFYIIKTDELKQMIIDDKYFRIHSDYSKVGYLFKLDVIAKNCLCI